MESVRPSLALQELEENGYLEQLKLEIQKIVDSISESSVYSDLSYSIVKMLGASLQENDNSFFSTAVELFDPDSNQPLSFNIGVRAKLTNQLDQLFQSNESLKKAVFKIKAAQDGYGVAVTMEIPKVQPTKQEQKLEKTEPEHEAKTQSDGEKFDQLLTAALSQLDSQSSDNSSLRVIVDALKKSQFKTEDGAQVFAIFFPEKNLEQVKEVQSLLYKQGADILRKSNITFKSSGVLEFRFSGSRNFKAGGKGSRLINHQGVLVSEEQPLELDQKDKADRAIERIQANLYVPGIRGMRALVSDLKHADLAAVKFKTLNNQELTYADLANKIEKHWGSVNFAPGDLDTQILAGMGGLLPDNPIKDKILSQFKSHEALISLQNISTITSLDDLVVALEEIGSNYIKLVGKGIIISGSSMSKSIEDIRIIKDNFIVREPLPSTSTDELLRQATRYRQYANQPAIEAVLNMGLTRDFQIRPTAVRLLIEEINHPIKSDSI